ncbi:MAG: TraR/DksA C4-type zinc finger protein, partial [Proteobacteria bacterium]|nr:TraR/DksA C4-type zinc finger protein [Pseudomonadota bacterium]
MADHALSPARRAALAKVIRARIRALRDEISAALRQSGDSEASRLANHLEETDDEAVADLETAIEVAALEREVRELRAMEAAAARVQTPDYGRCEDCSADIPFERLQVAAAATRCVPCQARREHARGT